MMPKPMMYLSMGPPLMALLVLTIYLSAALRVAHTKYQKHPLQPLILIAVMKMVQCQCMELILMGSHALIHFPFSVHLAASIRSNRSLIPAKRME
ncbi:hypothetical protein A4F85_01220 [Delftia sp. GW456-R20]|nr:hypothetical protein A4F85_01220 [Delftia sp. GW456-R20]